MSAIYDAVGNPAVHFIQFFPSSTLTQRPNSVPKYSRSFFTGSCSITSA